LIAQVWLPSLQTFPPQGLDSKIQVIGLTKLLCESPSLLDDTSGQQLWCGIFLALSTLLSVSTPPAVDDDGDILLVMDVQYDSAYSALSFAKQHMVDPFPEVADTAAAFGMALKDFSSRHPGFVIPLVQQALKSVPELAQGMESVFQKTGVRL
jgi:exportin-2 (importin alpha re-exporter)